MSYPRGLGDDVTDPVAAARARLESVAGIPYTGPATTADALLAILSLDTRIANGDLSAMIVGATYPDPWLQSIAVNYLRRYASSSDTYGDWVYNVARNTIPANVYKIATGQELKDNQVWQRAREAPAYAIMVEILDGGIKGSKPFAGPKPMANGGFSEEYLYDKSVYDSDFDYEDLRRDALAFKAKIVAEGARLYALRADAAARVAAQVAFDEGQRPAGPPSGWRYNGNQTWNGPDGLVYQGEENSSPWADGTPGVSINRPTQPTNTPQVPNGDGDARPKDLAPPSDLFLPTNTTPVATTAPPVVTPTGPTNTPDIAVIPFGPPRILRPLDITDGMDDTGDPFPSTPPAPLAAGFSSGGKLALYGAAALAAYFLTRGKR